MPQNIDNAPIKLDAKGNTVFCSVAANPRTDTRITVTLFPVGNGPRSTLVDDVEDDPKARIKVGEPSELKGAFVQVNGDTVKITDDSYRVVLRFYQGSEKIAESDPIEGTFGNKKLVTFRITCPLS